MMETKRKKIHYNIKTHIKKKMYDGNEFKLSFFKPASFGHCLIFAFSLIIIFNAGFGYLSWFSQMFIFLKVIFEERIFDDNNNIVPKKS